MLIEFWRGTGDSADLDREVGALVLSARLTTALQEVTDRGDRKALIVTYQKFLNIYVRDQTLINEGGGVCLREPILVSSYVLHWLISTLVQRHRLRTQQREEWESIVGETETYATTLGCPLALVRATYFFDLGCMTHFEAIRDAHKLRVLDTIEKVTEFKRKFFVVLLSQQYLALTAPATNSMLFETMSP